MRPSAVPDHAIATYPNARAMVIGKPPGYTDEEIGGLPALVDSEPRFPVIVRSFWRPSAEEVIALSEGAYIELEVLYWPMVPVALNVLGVPHSPSDDEPPLVPPQRPEGPQREGA